MTLLDADKFLQILQKEFPEVLHDESYSQGAVALLAIMKAVEESKIRKEDIDERNLFYK